MIGPLQHRSTLEGTPQLGSASRGTQLVNMTCRYIHPFCACNVKSTISKIANVAGVYPLRRTLCGHKTTMPRTLVFRVWTSLVTTSVVTAASHESVWRHMSPCFYPEAHFGRHLLACFLQRSHSIQSKRLWKTYENTFVWRHTFAMFLPRNVL